MKSHKVGNGLVYSFESFDSNIVKTYVSTRSAGVSTREYAELNLGLHVGDKEANVLKNREILAEALNIPHESFTYGQQTHGANIKIIKEDDKGRGSMSWDDGFPDTDGLITDITDTPLSILTADCAAVFLFDPVKRVVAIAHSGKEGTKSNIVGKIVTKMIEGYKSEPVDIIAGIGPCISSCCYEINLPKMITEQLVSAGIKPNNIENSELCTSCNSDIFFSYRAGHGKTGRFANIIMLNN